MRITDRGSALRDRSFCRINAGRVHAAFDTRSGRLLWRTVREASAGWGTPIAIRAGDHDEIIVNSQSRVCSYDPATGRELWNCSGSSYEVIPTPVVGHGMVFCSSGRAGPTLAIRPGGRGDVTGSHLVWTSPRGSPFVPSPILHGDHLYMVNDMASIVTCLEVMTGRAVWQGRLGVAQREGFSASPVVVDGKVFFTNDDGETFVLRAGPKFELLHVNRMGEGTLASPALVDGRWYIRTDRNLFAIVVTAGQSRQASLCSGPRRGKESCARCSPVASSASPRVAAFCFLQRSPSLTRGH